MTAIAQAMPARAWEAVNTSRVLEVASAFGCAIALTVYVLRPPVPVFASAAVPDDPSKARAAETIKRLPLAERVRYKGGEYLIAAYSGSPYTYASDLHIEKPGSTDMTVHGIDWLGKPFENPIYHGARVVKWMMGSQFGVMADLTHSKAYAPREQKVKLSGTKDGQPLPPESTIGEQFKHLEFTHGHNMLTLNLLWRVPFIGSIVSPYVGVGFGAALPHTEVDIRGEDKRTYEYQYAGPTIQALFGIEFRIPYVSYFVEYKFTSADYKVPLQNRDGSLLPFDLWNQFQRWWSGKEPEGGWASTKLTSHQVISGFGYRTTPAANALP